MRGSSSGAVALRGDSNSTTAICPVFESIHRSSSRKDTRSFPHAHRLMSESLGSRVFYKLARLIGQVQGLCGHNIPRDLLDSLFEFVLQLCAAHDFGRFSHLAEQLLKASEDTDQGAFVDFSHFAESMLADKLYTSYRDADLTYQI